MNDQELIRLAMGHGLSMMQAQCAALEKQGECAPMFAVLGPDGKSMAAGIFAPFYNYEEKIAAHRTLAEFASSQRAAIVVTAWDTYVSQHEVEEATPEALREVVDTRPAPRDDPSAHEALMLEICSAKGIVSQAPTLRYSRNDDGTIAFAEDIGTTSFTAYGEALAVIVRALATLGPKASRSTALRRLLVAGFAVLADDGEVKRMEDEWRARN